jgi:hypothetical protein
VPLGRLTLWDRAWSQALRRRAALAVCALSMAWTAGIVTVGRTLRPKPPTGPDRFARFVEFSVEGLDLRVADDDRLLALRDDEEVPDREYYRRLDRGAAPARLARQVARYDCGMRDRLVGGVGGAQAPWRFLQWPSVDGYVLRFSERCDGSWFNVTVDLERGQLRRSSPYVEDLGRPPPGYRSSQ